jgi:transcriptional regulator with XRE-family HTH domain
MTFGRRLRELREARRWSQVDLASHAGLSIGYISKLENDLYRRPSADVFLRLAKAVGVDPADLYWAAGYSEAAPESEVDDPELQLYLSQVGRLAERDRHIIKGVLRTMLEKAPE